MSRCLSLGLLLFVVACVDLSSPRGLSTDIGDPSDGPLGRVDSRLPGDGAQPGNGDGSGSELDAPAGLDAEETDGAQPGGDGESEPDAPVDAPLLENGESCGAAEECRSASCANGVCCATSCVGTCMACDVTGSRGSCIPVPVGQDPYLACDQDPPSSCGRDGTCDGAGACRRYPTGTVCALGHCEGAIEQAASTCNGGGTCTPGASRSCAPGVCAADSCASTCSKPGDCQVGFFCDGSTCRAQLGQGAACSQALACASGFCVDGVCCASKCDQSCFACNLSGAAGTCTAVAAGADPAGECVAEAAATCGRAGGCNGAGACRLHPAGVVCAAPSCTGSAALAASSCNGRGACVAPAASDCGRYLCAGTACATTCASSAGCKSPNVCSGTACVAPCAPESDAALCARLGKACGQLMATDNCGAARTVTSCGSCTAPKTCGGGGTPGVCGASAGSCAMAYSQGSCVGYSVGTKVASGGHNWTCSNGNCANCATNAACAPGGTGCPWGVVWTDNGTCQ